jgi:4-hydroxythreonine-4-phosphate dehydrogenase
MSLRHPGNSLPLKQYSEIPVFALTMGDPAGIGAEIAVKALLSEAIGDCRVAVIGDLSALLPEAGRLGKTANVQVVTDIRDAQPGRIAILDMKQLPPNGFGVGRVSAACGKASYAYILKGIELAQEGIAAGVITGPINKEALKMAGINYPGHTEILADACGIKEFSMVFYLRGVAVAHVTTHVSLRQAIDLITPDRVLTHIRLLDGALKRLGTKAPRIAVGGLNPHAGENGLFGDEEKNMIAPAIEMARGEGIEISGPYPPDTVFMRAFRHEFDGVVSMLHDHGFVALKSLDFEHGVNITIGLPIIRTSVGHGTAFDIAGKGLASPESLLSAIDAARLLHKNREPL